jgi:hypothetical protein
MKMFGLDEPTTIGLTNGEVQIQLDEPNHPVRHPDTDLRPAAGIVIGVIVGAVVIAVVVVVLRFLLK